MLTLRRSRPARRRRKRHDAESTAATSLADRPDLRIGNLLDDPRLRRAMGLDAPQDTLVSRPSQRFDGAESRAA